MSMVSRASNAVTPHPLKLQSITILTIAPERDIVKRRTYSSPHSTAASAHPSGQHTSRNHDMHV
jgi:hypothetical protein